jgi:hypothetical protein
MRDPHPTDERSNTMSLNDDEINTSSADDGEGPADGGATPGADDGGADSGAGGGADGDADSGAGGAEFMTDSGGDIE